MTGPSRQRARWLSTTFSQLASLFYVTCVSDVDIVYSITERGHERGEQEQRERKTHRGVCHDGRPDFHQHLDHARQEHRRGRRRGHRRARERRRHVHQRRLHAVVPAGTPAALLGVRHREVYAVIYGAADQKSHAQFLHDTKLPPQTHERGEHTEHRDDDGSHRRQRDAPRTRGAEHDQRARDGGNGG